MDLQMPRKAKDTPHLRLRIEPSLLARLQKSAEKNDRTLTGEIVDRLDASFKRDDIQGYVDATARTIAAKLFEAADFSNTRKAVKKMWHELDLKKLQELYPGTPIHDIARYLSDAAARRAQAAALRSAIDDQ